MSEHERAFVRPSLRQEYKHPRRRQRLRGFFFFSPSPDTRRICPGQRDTASVPLQHDPVTDIRPPRPGVLSRGCKTNPSPPCRTHAPVHQRATAAPLSTITNAIVITPATTRCRRRCPAPARPGRSRTQQPRRGQVESREQNIRHTRLNSRHKSDEYPSTTTFALLETQAPHTRASTRIHRKPRTSKP